MSGPPTEGAAGPAPVLLTIRQLDFGGTERQITEAAKSLDRSRFVPHVACFSAEGARGDELRAAKIPIVIFPVRSLYAPSTLAAASQFARYIHQHGIQIVHTFDVPTTLFGVTAARMARTPVVISSQRANRSLTTGPARRLLRVTDRMVDAIVVNCEAIRRHLVDEERVSPRFVHVCPNALDTAVFCPAASDAVRRSGDRPLVVGTLCVLRPEKAVADLITAFAEVRAGRPGIKLVIIGSGPCLPELRARCESLGLQDDCRFEIETSEVAARLREIDVFVLPSRSEALSNTLMEAMACGCAVVASRVGGNPELVQHRHTGLLFEAGDIAGLAASIRSLVDAPAIRAQLGAHAATFVRSRFSISAAAQQLADLYSTLLRARARPASDRA